MSHPLPSEDLIPLDAERMVVGAMIYDTRAVSRVAQLLKVEHFGDDHARMIYATCLEMWRSGVPVDLLTVTQQMRKAGTLEAVGGPFALVGYTRHIASSKHLDAHCVVVADGFRLRTLRQAGMKLMNGSMPAEDPAELIAALSVDIQRANAAEATNDVNAYEKAYELLNSNTRPKPIYLGMGPLDDMVFINDGNVITVRAASGVGKTAFVLSAVMNLMPQRKPWIVSLEMPADEMVTRALCQMAFVDIDQALSGRLLDSDRARLSNALINYGEALHGLDIDDSGTMMIDSFCARAEQKVNNEGVNLIVVDYAQLLDYPTKEFRSREEGLTHISKSIRATARKLNVPILCIVHVNREGEEAGSTQFEKDAHVRLSLIREVTSPGVMTVDIVKNRNGRTGKVDIPCMMRHGIVGRTTPPVWAEAHPFTPHKLPTTAPHPDNRIQPTSDAPF